MLCNSAAFWIMLPNNFFLAFRQKSSIATPKLISPIECHGTSYFIGHIRLVKGMIGLRTQPK